MSKSSALLVCIISVLVALLATSSASAACHNATWVACADDALSDFIQKKTEFEASNKNQGNLTRFYCGDTVAYYQEFAACTTTFDCWDFPGAIQLRQSKYNISECTPQTAPIILGSLEGAKCPAFTCEQLLPGSQDKELGATQSDSPVMVTAGTLAAMSLLVASLTF